MNYLREQTVFKQPDLHAGSSYAHDKPLFWALQRPALSKPSAQLRVSWWHHTGPSWPRLRLSGVRAPSPLTRCGGDPSSRWARRELPCPIEGRLSSAESPEERGVKGSRAWEANVHCGGQGRGEQEDAGVPGEG